MKGGGGVLLGCGLLIALGGLSCFVLVAAGAVNSAEEGTAAGIGSGLCCLATMGMVLGGVLFGLGMRGSES